VANQQFVANPLHEHQKDIFSGKAVDHVATDLIVISAFFSSVNLNMHGHDEHVYVPTCSLRARVYAGALDDAALRSIQDTIS
jgi:acetylornithine deacetylase/succinyl-diaminopimelate desuccinylase-like protein